MKVMDASKNQVIHMNRPLACSTCWFPCCLQSMEVSAPPGNVIGRVEQEWSLCFPSFAIKNHMGESVLRIEGPLCTFSMCGDVEFKVSSHLKTISDLENPTKSFILQIVTMNGDEVGKISKQWSGIAREMFTDADFFGISFPMDLDVRMKAVMLGACFLIVRFEIKNVLFQRFSKKNKFLFLGCYVLRKGSKS